MRLDRRTRQCSSRGKRDRIASFLGVACLVATLGGCATPVTEIKVAYTAQGAPARVEMKSPKRIRVGAFTDKRTTEQVYEYYSRSLHHVMRVYVVKSDVAEVITDAVKAELANQGYRVVQDEPDFVISGNLLSLKYTVRSGFFTRDTVEGGAQVKVIVRDTRENEIVWTDIVSGISTTKAGGEEGINLAVADLIENLVNSESLHAALR